MRHHISTTVEIILYYLTVNLTIFVLVSTTVEIILYYLTKSSIINQRNLQQ